MQCKGNISKVALFAKTFNLKIGEPMGFRSYSIYLSLRPPSKRSAAPPSVHPWDMSYMLAVPENSDPIGNRKDFIQLVANE